MNYLVKNAQGEIFKLTVVSGVPTLPEGMGLVGPESEINPNGLDHAVATLQIVELEPARQDLVSAEILAVPEVLYQAAIPEVLYQAAIPEVLAQAAIPEKWIKDGSPDVFVDPVDVTYTYVPAIPEVLAQAAVSEILAQAAVPEVAAVPAVPYQAAVYNNVPAVMGPRLIADSAKATAKASADLAKAYSNALANAIAFGSSLIIEFGSENMALGITLAGKTSDVRKAMAEVTGCLITGSLYDAIAEARLIPAGSEDAIFLTDARLLSFINKIETYLGKPLSSSL